MDLTPRRRRALSTALALFLAIESVSVVAAAAQTHVVMRDAPAEYGAAAAGSPPPPPADAVATRTWTAIDTAAVRDLGVPDPTPIRGGTHSATTVPPGAPTATLRSTPSAKPQAPAPKLSVPKKTPAPSAATRYSGRNHVWIPALHIDRSVAWFPCDRARPPDNHVYRWGCAGTNNVYLMGHAYSVFKPLHDAYVGHRLKVGIRAWYADAKGNVRAYAVSWWKVTRPTTDASWAWAAQDTPSMTLQTCVGSSSEYRLMVRLVEVGG